MTPAEELQARVGFQRAMKAIEWPADIVTYSERRAYVAGQQSLAPILKRCAYLLNSARLVIDDKVARDTAGEAVEQARAALAALKE